MKGHKDQSEDMINSLKNDQKGGHDHDQSEDTNVDLQY